MAEENHTPDVIAALAQETAHKMGCQARRWWQDTHNPRRLYIEVNHTLSNGQPLPVWISTLLPPQLACGSRVELPAERRADLTAPCVTKPPRGRRDFLTPPPGPAQAAKAPNG